MVEHSIVAVAFQDLTDAHDELASGNTSPIAVRRSFASFVDLSQKLTSYMRKEYSEKKGEKWVASDFDGWNDYTELFKQIRNDDQHNRPVSILVNETQYIRAFEDSPQLVATNFTWSFSLDDQVAVTPRDDMVIEVGDPRTGLPTGQRINPVKKEYEFHLSTASKKAEALLHKIGDPNVRTLSEKCFEVLSDYYQYYQGQLD